MLPDWKRAYYAENYPRLVEVPFVRLIAFCQADAKSRNSACQAL